MPWLTGRVAWGGCFFGARPVSGLGIDPLASRAAPGGPATDPLQALRLAPALCHARHRDASLSTHEDAPKRQGLGGSVLGLVGARSCRGFDAGLALERGHPRLHLFELLAGAR